MVSLLQLRIAGLRPTIARVRHERQHQYHLGGHGGSPADCWARDHLRTLGRHSRGAHEGIYNIMSLWRSSGVYYSPTKWAILSAAHRHHTIATPNSGVDGAPTPIIRHAGVPGLLFRRQYVSRAPFGLALHVSGQSPPLAALGFIQRARVQPTFAPSRGARRVLALTPADLSGSVSVGAMHRIPDYRRGGGITRPIAPSSGRLHLRHAAHLRSRSVAIRAHGLSLPPLMGLDLVVGCVCRSG